MLTSHHKESKVLYCFVSNGIVFYIGKATQSLISRMKGYQNPGPTQRTNIRVNKNIIQLLEGGLPIDIYVLTDLGLLKYGGFTVSLAGGLEDALINALKPDWNITGKPVDYKSPKQLERPRTHRNKPQDTGSYSFEVWLYPTYYNQGFFNVRQKYSDRFGKDQEMINIQLGNDGNQSIYGIIDRHANTNGTPRIRGRNLLRDWIQSNFHQGDSLVVEIISPVSILLKTRK